MNKFLELPPFEHPNPMKKYNKGKQVIFNQRRVTAWLVILRVLEKAQQITSRVMSPITLVVTEKLLKPHRKFQATRKTKLKAKENHPHRIYLVIFA